MVNPKKCDLSFKPISNGGCRGKESEADSSLLQQLQVNIVAEKLVKNVADRNDCVGCGRDGGQARVTPEKVAEK